MPVEKEALLVVDDEQMNRDMLSRRLARSGFTVDVACDGEEALRMIGDHPWDLILLDQMMPGRSGTEVLRELRTHHPPDELPVIMVTAIADSVKVAEALDAGANDYVTKPIDFTIALARIRSQLSRKQAESVRRRNEECYALAACAAHDGMWDWDLQADRIQYSTRWKEMLGLDCGAVTDSPSEWFSRVHPKDLPELQLALGVHLRKRTTAFECDYRMRTPDGRYLWMSGRGTALFNANGTAVRMAGSQCDITTRKTVDELTGLSNSVFFTDRVEAALDARDHSRGFAVLSINLDRLKLLNDSLGKPVGDQLLISFANRLADVVQESQTAGATDAPRALLARIGGDQFAILVENTPDCTAASEIAKRILGAMRPSFRVANHEFFASASIGIAMSRTDHTTVAAVLHDADTAVHAAKAQGRARAVIFDDPLRDKATHRLTLERDLWVALGQGQFRIFYQPRVDLHTGKICGFEALLRWYHPTRGIVPPLDFIPLAEETGLICEIGLWVLREACRQIRNWRERWPRPDIDGNGLDMAVNVSPVQLRDPELAHKVEEILGDVNLTPSALHIEITESSILENIEEARRFLLALKKLGVGLKLDDFATGYSCLAYLNQLPFDSIKIDRSFVKELGNPDAENRELVRAILDIARNLNLGVIAEGIETREAAEALKEMGCRYAQGYHFSRPVEPAAIERQLAGEL